MSAPALAFLSAALAIAGVAPLASAAARRLARAARSSERGPARRRGLGTAALRVAVAGGRRLAPVVRLAVPHDLERRIAAAGLRSGGGAPIDAREVMALKTMLALAGAGGGLMLGTLVPGRLGIVLLAVGPVAGFLAPDLWLVRRARERARAIRRELPGMLDLLRVTVEAGLPLNAALSEVGERSGGALGAEWRIVGREVALGVPLSASLQAMLARVPVPEVTALIGSLERAIRHGAPLADALAAQARDARAGRARRIREEAARAGPKIQLVVALLLVPSVLLLVAAALAAALIDGSGASLVGN